MYDLNRVYRDHPALHRQDFEADGFRWIDCNDADNSLLSFSRQTDHQCAVMVFNFTPVPREGFRLGVPEGGEYRLALNSDSSYYSGSNLPVWSHHQSESVPWMNQQQSIVIDLPPLAGLVLLKN